MISKWIRLALSAAVLLLAGSVRAQDDLDKLARAIADSGPSLFSGQVSF